MANDKVPALLRTRTPQIIEAYQAGLIRVGSPLGTQPEAWKQCARQAATIIAECAGAIALSPQDSSAAAKHMEYTRLLGSHRALQRIPATESIRAVEILWRALESVLDEIVSEHIPMVHRAETWQKVNNAYRNSSGQRLIAGMRGYEEVRVDSVVDVGRGDAEPTRTQTVPTGSSTLTPRENEILKAVAKARSNQQIASQLGISEQTVKRHLANAFNKLGATSRLDAVQKAFGPQSLIA